MESPSPIHLEITLDSVAASLFDNNGLILQITICQLNQTFSNSEATMLSRSPQRLIPSSANDRQDVKVMNVQESSIMMIMTLTTRW